jgi:hypothetical protein
MGSQKITLCVLEMGPEDSMGHPALVPAEGERKIMVPPKSPGGGKTIFAGIVKVDPAGGNLVGRAVNGLETILSQPIRDPVIEIFTGLISHSPVLTDADSVKKNTHNSPPHGIRDFFTILPDSVRFFL